MGNSFLSHFRFHEAIIARLSRPIREKRYPCLIDLMCIIRCAWVFFRNCRRPFSHQAGRCSCPATWRGAVRCMYRRIVICAKKLGIPLIGVSFSSGLINPADQFASLLAGIPPVSPFWMFRPLMGRMVEDRLPRDDQDCRNGSISFPLALWPLFLATLWVLSENDLLPLFATPLLPQWRFEFSVPLSASSCTLACSFHRSIQIHLFLIPRRLLLPVPSRQCPDWYQCPLELHRLRRCLGCGDLFRTFERLRPLGFRRCAYFDWSPAHLTQWGAVTQSVLTPEAPLGRSFPHSLAYPVSAKVWWPVVAAPKNLSGFLTLSAQSSRTLAAMPANIRYLSPHTVRHVSESTRRSNVTPAALQRPPCMPSP